MTILNYIYEVDFKGFSYGFRPKRSPHQALDALAEPGEKCDIAMLRAEPNLVNHS